MSYERGALLYEHNSILHDDHAQQLLLLGYKSYMSHNGERMLGGRMEVMDGIGLLPENRYFCA